MNRRVGPPIMFEQWAASRAFRRAYLRARKAGKNADSPAGVPAPHFHWTVASKMPVSITPACFMFTMIR